MLDLLHQEIWAQAARHKGRGPVFAAVSYVTFDHLSLGRGDTLICDASDKCIAGGATSATVLSAMHKRGVRLIHLPKLHAKLVQLPGHVLLGSANMTDRSLGLREASVLTDDPGVRQQATQFLDRLMALKDLQKIDVGFLRRIRAIEVVHGGDADSRTGAARGRRQASEQRVEPCLWVASERPLSDRERKKTETALAELTQTDNTPTFTRWSLKYARAGLVMPKDYMVSVNRNTRRAHPPTRVDGVVPCGGYLLHTFNDVRSGSVAWEHLAKVLHDAGVYTRPGMPQLLKLDPQTERLVRKLFRQK